MDLLWFQGIKQSNLDGQKEHAFKEVAGLILINKFELFFVLGPHGKERWWKYIDVHGF